MKKRKVFVILSILFFSFLQQVFWKDVLHEVIENQISNWNRPILIGTWATSGSWVEYMNKMWNTDVRGNYFKWYYYDPFYWFFKLDWSNNSEENVRFVGGTGKCITGYWYRLDGAALSQTAGKIYFNYDSNHQVYYCVNTNTLYGKAYSPVIGSQNFEWVSFSLIPSNVQTNPSFSGNTNFVNDSTIIFYVNNQKEKLTPSQEKSVQLWETTYYETWSENIFYIFKPKK